MRKLAVFPSDFLIICLLCFSQGCDKGLDVIDPTEQVQHGIQGQILFKFNDQWPENLAETRLVASKDFPPSTDASSEGIIFSDPIPAGVDTFDYQLSLDTGVYQFIGVIAREKGKSWEVSNIYSVYSQLPDILGFIFPDSVAVETDTSIVGNVNMEVDLTRGSINGKVTFEGEWPDNTLIAGVAVFEKYSGQSLFEVLGQLRGISIIPPNVDASAYSARVPDGTYDAVVAVVITQEVLDNILASDISDIAVGFYPSAADPGVPGVVQVTDGENITGIDINANLGSIKK